MPRELVHWIVLNRAAERAAKVGTHHGKKPTLATAALGADGASISPAAMLGAVAHDAPYFLEFGRHSFRGVADSLHGTTGEDTFKPMIQLAAGIETAPDKYQQVLWSFFAGMLSHIATDITFHPMIFYITGNYHDQDPVKQDRAQTLHRKLETFLESWVRDKLERNANTTCRFLRKRLGGDFKAICSVLEKSLPPNEPTTDASLWQNSFAAMINAQSMFSSRPLGAILRGLSPIFPVKLEPIDALFRYGRETRMSFFDVPIDYQNPITGEWFKYNCDELLERAVEMNLHIWKLFDANHFSVTEPGPSLNFGVPAAPPDTAQYFAEKIPDFLK